MTEAEVKKRLGMLATGAKRDIRAVVEISAGEELEAVAVALRGRHGWVVAATDRGIRLARRPIVLGSGEQDAFDWGQLSGTRSGVQAIDLDFGAQTVKLSTMGPLEEFEAFVQSVRRRVRGPDEETQLESLRALARLKLGRLHAKGHQFEVDALTDRLEPGEEVQRLAAATTDFDGLLVLTDRRLLLLRVGLRRGSERLWSVQRADIEAVEAEDDGLLLTTAGNSTLLTKFLPAERREEFHMVLMPR